ncbi:MAG: NAD(P)-dependent glycerol-3-phosphate dehydrogenase [Acidimicrobiales bacterium]|nr:NAD(P)-dependent glycerol-3-phosphate dehydrogenase [Acidimicrobiales bacterium]RZV48474.1 MAG: NAD(P)-dependent glycerol-3-phosphate dehydrogenase [Acidimicrobiales bacterium]
MKVAVLGGGSWGTTVASLCAHNAPTTIYARRPEVVEGINQRNENPRYLPGFGLHNSLVASPTIAGAASDADVLVMGVASAGFADTLTEVAPLISADVPIVSLAKGLDRDTGKRMTELISDVLPDNPVGVLTGPNLAKEILAGHAAATVIAFDDVSLAEELQGIFATDVFRVYTNPDRIGCELGGALKNVIAIAAGMAGGLGTGDNTLAAVITRGLAELTRLGIALGGHENTFMGLAGMGDLLATCMSPQSRNRTVGFELGKGRSLDEIVEEMQQVAEGLKSAPVVAELGRQHGVDLPICNEVCAVVAEGRTAREVYKGLLRRPQQDEVDRH